MQSLPVSKIRNFILYGAHAKEDRRFKGIAPIYPFTTENLAGYFPFLKINGKTILTVSGSGDQVLNAMYFGAKQIDAFDINLLSSLYTELKLQALRFLSYDDFLSYFSFVSDNRQVLSRRLYDKFSDSISSSAKYVFDLFYQAFNDRGYEMRNSHLFYNRPPVDHQSAVYNEYLQNPDKYLQTRNNSGASIYRWLQSDIMELKHILEPAARYDVILLSNIADYAHLMYPGSEHLKYFTQQILHPLVRYLSPEGILCAACIFLIDAQVPAKARNDMYVEQKRREVLHIDGLEYQEIRFPSAIAGHEDGLVVLRKS
jgi:hypothetical protein